MEKKKIIFLTGTRADFGKIKSLIQISQKSENFDVHIFVTGMHMNKKYGFTVEEIEKSGFKNIYKFINHDSVGQMDRTLSKTIDGFSQFIGQIEPDLIIVHGDRIEALAGAIVGSLNNILVAHIEGGEVSGTIDELIRHSVSKLSHIHLTANLETKKRLLQLGEYEESIQIIGSPDLDLMNSKKLPTLEEVKSHYEIPFSNYAIAIYHPVTTDYKNINLNIKNFVDSLIESHENYIVVYPNNDLGTLEILNEYKRLTDNQIFKIFPSIRFESFLTLLKYSKFIIGNSSTGIREAPIYNIPTIDIGTRQLNRTKTNSVINVPHKKEIILKAISQINELSLDQSISEFGNGDSDTLFFNLINNPNFWKISCQKYFQDI